MATVQETHVDECVQTDCAYNEEKACHAMAITIDKADAGHASCGTYLHRENGEQGGSKAMIANVGACKAASCVHNDNLMCTAGDVFVGSKDGEVSCLTYRAR